MKENYSDWRIIKWELLISQCKNFNNQNFPYSILIDYNRLVYSCEKQWMQPKRGLLAGTIIETELPENNFILMDLDNNRWKIEASKVIWKGKITPATGLKIKLIGKLIDDNNFKAMEIRPWQQGQGRFMMGGNR